MFEQKPILVVLAAGMGSRYGGLKQIEPFGPKGEFLLEYSLYDAYRAGFERVIFITGRGMQDFAPMMDRKLRGKLMTRYVPQKLTDLPTGLSIPEGRVKPWGTGHAILVARDYIDAPFAVINADDYYGPASYRIVYDYLTQAHPGEALLVNFILGNTLSRHGYVARGICHIDEAGYLDHIVERKQIKDAGDKAAYTLDGGESWQPLAKDSPCSMNFWGFHPSVLEDFAADFVPQMREHLPADPLKYEYLLPTVVDALIQTEKLKVTCLSSPEQWYGVTYREDKANLAEALARMVNAGLYPQDLWISK